MGPFDLAGLSGEKDQLEARMAEPGFWNDVENANKVNQRIKSISGKLDKYRKLSARSEDLEVLIDMADEENDESLLP
ncbi:MAG TPA: PCRF domain-containing protein, partial [Clostridia bacterium]|nr:PCRF domain-containing protein [Clostridia bacterium]